MNPLGRMSILLSGALILAMVVGPRAGHPSIAKWANQGYELIIL